MSTATLQFVKGTNKQVPRGYRLDVERLRTIVEWAARDARAIDRISTILSPVLKDLGWNQETWAQEQRNGVCKTAGCIAGGAVFDAGYVMIYDDDGAADLCVKGINGYDQITGKPKRIADPEAEEEYVDHVATRLFGLTTHERSALFEGDNNIGDVVLIARSICAARGLDLGVEFDADRMQVDRFSDSEYDLETDTLPHLVYDFIHTLSR